MQDIDKIYEEDFEIVYKYLFCLTHNSDIAEELAQETFYRAVQKIDSFKGKCKISVWLCQIAKNLWYDELKKKKIERLNYDKLFFDQTEDKMEDTIISNLELSQQLQDLDKQTQEVIGLRIVGDLSFKEIADILNQTETWARVTFYRGKKKLRGDGSNERKE